MTPPPGQSAGRYGDAIIAPLQPPADVHLDDTSDAMLKNLDGFKQKMTGPLGALYKKWIAHPCKDPNWNAIPPAYGESDEETRLLGELGGFGFGHLWGAGGRAGNLGAAAKVAQESEVQVKQALTGAWRGKAADAAGEKLDDLNKSLGEYAGYVNGFHQALQGLWATVRKPVQDVVNVPNVGSAQAFLAGHNPDDCAGMDMFVGRLDNAISWGRDLNTIFQSEVATEAEDSTGPIAPQDLRSTPGLVDLDTGFNSKFADMFCREMDEFARGYANAMNQYRQAIKDAHKAAQNALRAFADGLNVPTDPFGSLHLGSSGNPGGGRKSEGGGSQSGNGQSGSGSGGSGPSAPPPPPPPAAPPQPTATPDPNLNPVTHQPLETDPATGEPYPIDPKTGEAIKDGPARDTVTVQQGDHKISMEEPDENGEMGISVDDGSGRPKDYQLDFDDSKPADPTAGVTPTAPEASQGTDEAHHPGPDGKIHIEDGALKITAERPDGQDGPTVVTVDDGKGEPTKYTLGDSASSGDPRLTPDRAAVDPGVRTDAAATPQTSGGGRHALPDVPDTQAEPAPQHQAATTKADIGGSQPLDPNVPQAEPSVVSGGSDESTSAQSVTESVSGTDLFGEAPAMTGVVDGELGDTSSAGFDAPSAGPATELGSAPGGTSAAPGAGGMGMMGGMMGGMGGAGGGGGDDQERTSSFRIDGGLFDTTDAPGRISGSLDDETIEVR